MARLFSAIVPPDPVLAELAAQVDDVAGSMPEMRWIPVRNWHVTLGFFGDDDDPARRSAWLRRRVIDRPAPRLRLLGSGSFPGVLWIGLEPAHDDVFALTRLAAAAGAGRRAFHAHLTVARWRGPAGWRRARDLLANYSGSWFQPPHVTLLRSDLGPTGPTYTEVERVPLGHTERGSHS